MQLKIKKLDRRAVMPKYATDGSAGLDLCVLLDEPFVLEPFDRKVLPTGLAMEIPQGHVGLLFPRSSVGVKLGIGKPNSVGVIDSDYRGEVKVSVINYCDKPVIIDNGMRMSQLIVVPIPRIQIVETGELEGTARGDGGFGSTGR